MQKVSTALVKAQKEYSPVIKNSTNEFFSKGNKISRYADLAACVDAVLGALNANGIALVQKSYDCANGVMVETVFVHESGEMLECGILHFPAKADPQGHMSALTYARRGSLMAACGIAPEDDDGNAASTSKTIKISATKGSWGLIAPDRQAVLQDVKDAIEERFDADDIFGVYENYAGIVDDDEKIALWSRLNSQVRRAIKKQGVLAQQENKGVD